MPPPACCGVVYLHTCKLDVVMMRLGMLMVVIIVALLVLLSGPTLASATLTNAGMLALRDELMAQDDLDLGTYLLYDALCDDAMTARAMRSLRRAVALDGDSLSARWALGRAALATRATPRSPQMRCGL